MITDEVFADFKFKIGDLVQHRSRPPIGGYIVCQRFLCQGVTGTTYRAYLVSGDEGLRQKLELELQASEVAPVAGRWNLTYGADVQGESK